MAGNEQFHNRAFHAAETGIEKAWNTNTAFATNADYPATAGTFTSQVSTYGNDKYKFRISRTNNGSVDPAPTGSSGNLVGLVRFKIQAIGTSERNSNASHSQELYWEVKKVDDFGPLRDSSNASACGTSDLDSTASTC